MNIPEGWKLVPKKETSDMRSAFRDAEKSALLSGHDHIEAFFCGYRAMLAAAPTPPEKDEPVAFVDKRGDFWSIDRAKEELADGNTLDLNPLYTAPQSDKLRKAAEEVYEEFQRKIAHGDNGAQLLDALENLRAALEGK